jgi:hypothetical protein
MPVDFGTFFDVLIQKDKENLQSRTQKGLPSH